MMPRVIWRIRRILYSVRTEQDSLCRGIRCFPTMHLRRWLGQDKSGEEWYPGQWLPDAANFHAKTGEEEVWIGTEEIDRILDRTYNANKKDKDAGATNGYKKKRIIESSPRFCFRRREAEGCRRGISAGGRL